MLYTESGTILKIFSVCLSKVLLIIASEHAPFVICLRATSRTTPLLIRVSAALKQPGTEWTISEQKFVAVTV